jgi:hypothetical protein
MPVETIHVKHTLVFCDLHKLLIYIRKSQNSNEDVMIKTREDGLSAKFYISLRKGLKESL